MMWNGVIKMGTLAIIISKMHNHAINLFAIVCLPAIICLALTRKLTIKYGDKELILNK